MALECINHNYTPTTSTHRLKINRKHSHSTTCDSLSLIQTLSGGKGHFCKDQMLSRGFSSHFSKMTDGQLAYRCLLKKCPLCQAPLPTLSSFSFLPRFHLESLALHPKDLFFHTPQTGNPSLMTGVLNSVYVSSNCVSFWFFEFVSSMPHFSTSKVLTE